MKRNFFFVLSLFAFAIPALAQSQDVKVAVDTIAVQADGTYEADPDLATLTFVVSTQDKDLKHAYDTASSSMQRIVDLAGRNGLMKEEITSGVLTVVPSYSGDRNRKTRAYAVDGKVVLRLKDFTKIGPVIDEAMQDGITDFRSLTYSLSDEEAAKQKAVAEAVRRASGRAASALNQKGQKLGALRYANLDVKQATGVSQFLIESPNVGVLATSGGFFGGEHKSAITPLPVTSPEKITVSATVQCVFQIL